MNQNPTRKRTLLIVSGVIILVLVGFGVFASMQKTDQQNDQAHTTKDEGVKSNVATDDLETISETLPNGKTATYANTDANRNITFASSDMGVDYVALSHRAVADFIAAADKDIVTRLCGADGELADKENVIIGEMSTSVRMIQYPTDNSCLDELATMRNSDPELRSAAAELVKQVEADIKQFYATVIIK